MREKLGFMLQIDVCLLTQTRFQISLSVLEKNTTEIVTMTLTRLSDPLGLSKKYHNTL